MPELAELYQMSQLISATAEGHTFTKAWISDVTRTSGKNPDVTLPNSWKIGGSHRFTLSSRSRGKELQLVLRRADQGERPKKKSKTVKQEQVEEQTQEEQDAPITILCRCGMTGHWVFSESETAMPAHAHLNFLRDDGRVLSYVDPRRFGRWEISSQWGADRSPCPLLEFDAFKSNIVNNLHKSVFETTRIGEMLLDQRYFNGIGNYLRAEILFRAGISPFISARKAIEIELELDAQASELVKSEHVFPEREKLQRRQSTGSYEKHVVQPGDPEFGRILQLCNTVPQEVINAKFWYNDKGESGKGFDSWLRCYGKLSSAQDSKGRTIWYGAHQHTGKAPEGKPKASRPKSEVTASTRVKGQKRRVSDMGVVSESTATTVVSAETVIVKVETRTSRRKRKVPAESANANVTAPAERSTKKSRAKRAASPAQEGSVNVTKRSLKRKVTELSASQPPSSRKHAGNNIAVPTVAPILVSTSTTVTRVTRVTRSSARKGAAK